MRIWTIHPKYLDRAGLLGAWREGLLAQKCIESQYTSGYSQHAQLDRFKQLPHEDAKDAIYNYLEQLALEGENRGYKLNRQLIHGVSTVDKLIPVSLGQVEYEIMLLLYKLQHRDLDYFDKIMEAHYLGDYDISAVFDVDHTTYHRESWEKVRPEVLDVLDYMHECPF